MTSWTTIYFCISIKNSITLNQGLLDFSTVLPEEGYKTLCLASFACLPRLAEDPSCFWRTSTVTIAPFLSPHKITFPYKQGKNITFKTPKPYLAKQFCNTPNEQITLGQHGFCYFILLIIWGLRNSWWTEMYAVI